jgi:hypothetical protein
MATLLVLVDDSMDTSDITDDPELAAAVSISVEREPSSEAASMELLTESAAASPSLDPPDTASAYVLTV